MKYLQEYYWGSGKWNQLYALRTAVEGVFGNLKNHGTEGVRRGFYQTDGIHMVTLAVTAAAACYNIRTLEKFSRDQGQRIDHPLMNHPIDERPLENVLLEGDEVIDYVERHTPPPPDPSMTTTGPTLRSGPVVVVQGAVRAPQPPSPFSGNCSRRLRECSPGGAAGNRTPVLERSVRSSPGAVCAVAFLGPAARTDTSATGSVRKESRSPLLTGGEQQVS